MKCVFCSMIYSNPEYDVSRSKNPKSISGHKFQINLIKGLLENSVNLKVLNIQRIRTVPFDKQLSIKRNEIKLDNKNIGIDISYLNFPFLNYLTQSVSLKKEIKRIINENPEENIVLLVFNTHYIQTKVVLSLKKQFPSLVTCNVVGDLYGEYGLKNTSRGLQKFWQRHVEKKQEQMQIMFDKYVLLTPMMKDALNVKEGDYTVVEGFYDEKRTDGKNVSGAIDNSNKKTVFYAGSLRLAYGIEHLLKSFELINKPDYMLYIAGSGEGDTLVKEYSEKDSRIKYLGFLSPDDVKRYQQSATVLVSPRKSDELFVKYSFPSKTFECLASGKPYIAHKLPCEPDEYGKYIQYPDNESDEALSWKIEWLCELNADERNAIGEKAKQFIYNEKNVKVMCRKVCDLLNSCFKS